jgi:CRP/FNR family cyclic AMP-dependent transcriptional regulator
LFKGFFTGAIVLALAPVNIIAEEGMSVADLLRRVSLFSDLSEDELDALVGCLGKRTFAKDMILFHKGNPAQSLYIIESGRVRAFAVSESGHEMTFEVYGPGECFGETALLDGNLRSTAAQALQATVAYTLRRNDFLRYIEHYPLVARRVIELLAHRLDHAIGYAENLVFLDVAGRVAAILVELVARDDVAHSSFEQNVRVTQVELAGLACASREMVNKVLHAYHEQGVIELKGHRLLILDLASLMRKTTH